ncbi:hypothetical protein ACF1GT_00585 [Streptomyces sp. NPDC014636]|uniref:hypothetical protein n=1 Tax=Streptomyces sp. NPDC014636 TaxID=3364876 RepID=UPI0036F749AB
MPQIDSRTALAKRLHRSQGWVPQRLALFNLPPELHRRIEEPIDLLRAVAAKPASRQEAALEELKLEPRRTKRSAAVGKRRWKRPKALRPSPFCLALIMRQLKLPPTVEGTLPGGGERVLVFPYAQDEGTLTELGILAPAGALGAGFDADAFVRGIAARPDVIACDTGATDSSPPRMRKHVGRLLASCEDASVSQAEDICSFSCVRDAAPS